jgi:hypothetical protein
MKFALAVSAVLFAAAGAVSQANAAIITGSALATQADAAQLEGWLAQGNIALSNIFTKKSGDNSTNLHQAIDGKGATFTLMQVTDMYGVTSIIGGYNPQSWNSNSGYTMNSNVADRTGFLFNLTTDTIQRQALQAYSSQWGMVDGGLYQTYNYGSYGPSFGGGHDLYVYGNLNNGSAYAFSYGGNYGLSNIFGRANGTGFQVTGLEVFTVAQQVAVVPEPTSIALFGIALCGLFGLQRRRAK